MKYRTLGRTGLSVSEIGFGAWGIGGMWGPTDDAVSRAALHTALDGGITFFDTALAYGQGHSESLISAVLKERKPSVVIATKIPPMNWRWPARHTSALRDIFPPRWIRECTEKSLANLGVESLDVQQFHVWTDAWMDAPDFPEWKDECARLIAEGKVRHFGVSINDHEPDSALRIVDSGLISTVQVIHNIFDQSPENRLFPLCRKLNIGVIDRVPFDEGSLTGTFTAATTFPDKDWRREYFTPERMAETLSRVEDIKKILAAEGIPMAMGALKYCLHHPAVSSVIPGMRQPANVRANIQASDGTPLPDAIAAQLKKHAWIRNFYD